jgi:nicotinamide mononucleotide transporter
MSIYGWYFWSRKKKGKPTAITFNTRKDWIISVSFFILSWGLLYFILREYTDSSVPVADSFASAAAYTGMWQMARKKVENWAWWILTNLASIPLFFYKGAVFTSFQYIVFLLLAVMGLQAWTQKVMQKNAARRG